MLDKFSSRFNLVVASLHHPTYGFDKAESTPEIREHFLCIHKSKNTTPKESKTIRQMSKMLHSQMRAMCKSNIDIWPQDVGIRNIYTAMSSLAQPQIGETMILPGDEMVVILKTVWIRLLQRTWKNICTRRKEIIRKRCETQAMYERERSGTWPSDCQEMPGLRGMLSGLTAC
jgi:hypothetical protein